MKISSTVFVSCIFVAFAGTAFAQSADSPSASDSSSDKHTSESSAIPVDSVVLENESMPEPILKDEVTPAPPRENDPPPVLNETTNAQLKSSSVDTESNLFVDYGPYIVGSTGLLVVGGAVLIAGGSAAAAAALAISYNGSATPSAGIAALGSALPLAFGASIFFATGLTGATIAAVLSTALSLFIDQDFSQALWTFVGATPGMLLGLVASLVGVVSALFSIPRSIGGPGPDGAALVTIPLFLISLVAGVAAPVVAGVGAGFANGTYEAEE